MQKSGHVTTEAEVGVMCLQVNTQRGLLETRRKARKDASLKKAWTTDILISTSSLPELRENTFVILRHSICGTLLWKSWKTYTRLTSVDIVRFLVVPTGRVNSVPAVPS